MNVQTQVTRDMQGSPEALFAFATSPSGLAETIRPVGPIPGVASATVLGDGPMGAGTLRKVILTDKSTLDEEVLVLTAPSNHTYRVTGFSGFFGLLVRSARAEWRFEPSALGTTITWHYSFELTSPAVALLAIPLVKLAMNKLMANTLKNIAARAPTLAE
ncbi:MAG: SRPBCC family protein [Deltaproteobacteria bacterium]|nr:SRPBCC family protein [Deltaproteobacteria bacterium]